MIVPKFSIIIATFNSGEKFWGCLGSIFSQTFDDYEVIVIDGGSNDDTLEVIQRNRQRIAYWITEPDGGIYDAWNKGLKRSRGEWVCFVGADDFFWDNEVLSETCKCLETAPIGMSVAYGRVALVNREGSVISMRGEPWDSAKGSFQDLMSIPHPGAMHRRELFNRRGVFDTQFRIAGDYELLLRELPENEAFFMPGIITVGVGMGGVSSTPAGMFRSLVEVRRAQVKHGKTIPSWRWTRAFSIAIIRIIVFAILGDRYARTLMDKGRATLGKPPFWTAQD
jgi:glycosyltransferase involved in cell wall biosynthesis